MGHLLLTHVICVFFTTSLFCKEIHSNIQEPQVITQHAVLDRFFRALLEESQGGYVLYGNKPVCTEGILIKEDNLFMLNAELHQRSVILKEGLKIWQSLPSLTQNQPFFIQSYDTLSYGWKECVLINRPALLKTIEENILLFQYILEPTITPEKLFQNLTNPAIGFSPALNHDKVLTGIVLGFGTQNALYVGHMEMIAESLQRKRVPASTPLSLQKYDPIRRAAALQDELLTLEKNLLISHELIKTSAPPIPWFGCLNNAQTRKLLSNYRKAHKKIQKALKSKCFLEEVLAHFFNDSHMSKEIVHHLSNHTHPLNNADWNSMISLSILQGIPYQDAEWIDHLIEGMQMFEDEHPLLAQEKWDDLLDSFDEINELINSMHLPAGADATLTINHNSLKKEVAQQLGTRTWAHFKKGEQEGYTLPSIIHAIRALHKENKRELSIQETDQLTQLHWKIYHAHH